MHPLEQPRPVFHWHHWDFDCPAGAASLASSPESGCQAFRAGVNAWAFQFHLELDQRLIRRWLTLDFYREDLARSGLQRTPEEIGAATREHLPSALALAGKVFGNRLGRLEPRGSASCLLHASGRCGTAHASGTIFHFPHCCCRAALHE